MVSKLITAQLTLSIRPRHHICSHKTVTHGFFLQKMRSVSLFVSLFWSKSDPLVPEMKRWYHTAQPHHAAAALTARTTSSKHRKFPPVLLLKPFLEKYSSLFLNLDSRIHLLCPTEDQRCQQNTSSCAEAAPAIGMLKNQDVPDSFVQPMQDRTEIPSFAPGTVLVDYLTPLLPNFMRTPLCQAMVKSQLSLAGGKAIFKCVVRESRRGSLTRSGTVGFFSSSLLPECNPNWISLIPSKALLCSSPQIIQ